MITRIAIFEGRVKDGCEERFYSEIDARLVPLWRQFPHATNVRLLRVVASDPDAAPIAMIQQVDYPSEVALEEAIASPVRARARGHDGTDGDVRGTLLSPPERRQYPGKCLSVRTVGL